MKRYGNLWETLISFENLFLAYKKAIKGKRIRSDIAYFIFHTEDGLLRLQEELQNKTYQPGVYRAFYIYEKKRRLISAAPFRDRIVHHALCNILEPIFENSFIFDLYSNRKGKGIHSAVKRAQGYASIYPYVLKCDIKKYFPSIDHAILKEIVRRKIKCYDTLWLTDLIIDRSNPQEDGINYFTGDTLFTAVERRRGLPIGNQTSQFFSNLYLSQMDHFIKETLKVKGYIRYVDDFLLFGGSKSVLWELKKEVENFLSNYRLKFKSDGVTLYQIEKGVPFLGYTILPSAILVKREAILRFRRKVKIVRTLWRRKKIDLERVRCFLFGTMGHFAQANSYNLRCKLMKEAFC